MSKPINTNAVLSEGLFAQKALSRRQLMRLFTAGTIATVGGASLAACGQQGETNQKVTFQAAGWPLRAMPTAKERKEDYTKEAYGRMLDEWLKDNPGVEIKNVNAEIWSQVGLTTAVASGTAPTWYGGGVLGGFQDEPTRAALAGGLAAETTELHKQYNTEKNVIDKAREAWVNAWNIDGKYYGAPNDFYLGRGVIYRRDLIKELGLEEPKSDWNWQDYSELAKALTTDKRKGAGFQNYTVDTMLKAEQFELLSRVPKPDSSAWRWEYKQTANADHWEKVVGLYRTMYFKDKSVLSDLNYQDEQVRKAFARGDVAMIELLALSYANKKADEVGYVAAQMNKPLHEVVGFAMHPRGLNGAFANTQVNVGIVCLSPRLKSYALDKAYNLYTYYYLGNGLVREVQEKYKLAPQESKESTASDIYFQPLHVNKLMQKIDGVPGDTETYLGKEVLQSMLKALEIPIIPLPSRFIPTEKRSGPTTSAMKDAISGFAFSEKNINELLKSLETTSNTQAQSIPSEVSTDAFRSGAKKYYQAIGDFWQKESPDFYTEFFKPFYDKQIAPALK